MAAQGQAETLLPPPGLTAGRTGLSCVRTGRSGRRGAARDAPVDDGGAQAREGRGGGERPPTRRRILAGLALGPLLLSTAPRAFAAGEPPVPEQPTVPKQPPPIRFDVLRAGGVIGSHLVDFAPGEGGYSVRTRIDIAVRLLGVTVFVYKHDSTEVWTDGRLVRFDSDTIDDDSEFFVRGRAAGGDFRIENRKGTEQAPADIMVASYWTPEIARRTQLIDPQRGRVKTQQLLGEDSIRVPLPAGPVQATRYRLEGITNGWVAYDDRGRWVAAELKKKGSDILYRLRG
jgi:Family of unknown function (DUF6134)